MFSSWHNLYTWTYSGVNFSLPGNGGLECVQFVPTTQKVIETVVITSVASFVIYCGFSRLKLPKVHGNSHINDVIGKRVLAAIMCLIFGVEIGFKLSTKQMIWILNPCHIVTILQIYMLMAPRSRVVMGTFRIHMHCLNGATIALLFPVVNTRLLPFEKETYYIQHILMMIVPCYLISLGDVFTPEPLYNFDWVLVTCGLQFVYHFVFLQGLALLTRVNLNNMICPAISDPFYGRWYRVWATAHQTALIFLHGKVYTLLCSLLLPKRRSVPTSDVNNSVSNGYTKVDD